MDQGSRNNELFFKVTDNVVDTCQSQTVLSLSEKYEPSLLLGVGGLLFEIFVIRKCNIKTHNTFMKLLNDFEEKKSTRLYFQDFKKEVLTNFTLPFWFHVITTSPTINRKRNKPLAQLTLMLEYRGLSRFGIEILAACKVATHTTT